MYAKSLFCEVCDWQGLLEIRYDCPVCGYSLSVDYDYNAISAAQVKEVIFAAKSLWDFGLLLPLRDKKNRVSLGEGGTPLLKSVCIGKAQGVDLYFKDETRNPTCSFKDRPNTVGISMAIELGAGSVAIASTGNGAASLAAYAALAGLPCRVFVPEHTSESKVRQAKAHGAEIVKVPGDYSKAFHAAKEACMRNNWANCTSTYLNPYTLEGDKTIAYEIYAQMGGVPDWVIIPLGAGPMLSGVYKGFLELEGLGLTQKLPKMAGVQAKNCAPITTAFESGADEVRPVETKDTVAHAIADPLTGYEQDGTRTLRCIRRSGGVGISVEEQLIVEYAARLARREGLFAEASSATAPAAIELMRQQGHLKAGESVVAVITGHGLKD